MKTSALNLPRIFVIVIIAAGAFCVGYVTPHNLTAAAATAAPRPVPTEGVPIGVGGHGLAQIWQSQTDTTIAGGKGWPCNAGKPCTVDIQLRATATTSQTPAQFDCSKDATQKNCLSFSGTNYDITIDNPPAPSTGSQTVNVAGMIQIY
jgi:hypothetical protein